MTHIEARVRDGALGRQERELERLRERGPWHDPAVELLLSGQSHAEKVSALESRINALRIFK